MATSLVRKVLDAVKASKKPILYVGGGAINSECAAELYEFATKLNIPSQ